MKECSARCGQLHNEKGRMCEPCKEKRRVYYKENRAKCIKIRREWYAANREHCLKKNRRWQKKNQERSKFIMRRSALRRRFGITPEQYNAMLLKQNSVCKICERRCSTGWHLAVDHDHDTGLIRGLLCRDCNTVLGKVDESVEILRKMITHITRNKRRKNGIYVPKSNKNNS